MQSGSKCAKVRFDPYDEGIAQETDAGMGPALLRLLPLNGPRGRKSANQSPLATGGESAPMSGVDYQGHTNRHLEGFARELPFCSCHYAREKKCRADQNVQKYGLTLMSGKMACKSVQKGQSQEKCSRRSWGRNQMGNPR
jgi:hypothetical protein